MTEKSLNKRWFYLATGVFAMLFSGVLYAWSILKIPFNDVFGWSASVLSLNFTLTMCFFCLGAFFGSLICKKIGPKFTLMIAGVLVGAGFVSTGMLSSAIPYLLYVTYAFLAGTGIGICYNVVVSTVCSWFPDKKGFCSGCLMMGFGISTLMLGNVISVFFENPAFGWEKTYIILGIVLAAVLIIAGSILRLPAAGTQFPAAKAKKSVGKEAFEVRDFSTAEMLKSFTFWRAFIFMAFITAVGNSVISFARDLVISVDATPVLATTLVGVLSVCNGIGRILTGAVYDALGRRTTMIAANILTIIAAGITLLAVQSLPHGSFLRFMPDSHIGIHRYFLRTEIFLRQLQPHEFQSDCCRIHRKLQQQSSRFKRRICFTVCNASHPRSSRSRTQSHSPQALISGGII